MASERSLFERFERAGPMTWLLAAIAGWAVLLSIAAVAGMGSELRPTQLFAATPLPPPTPMQTARIGPLAQYSEAASRPLFTQDRRPRSFMATGPEGSEEGVAQAQTLDFILTGVVISPQVQLAILQPTGGGASQRVRVGKTPEGAAGWQLLSLEPRRATFQGNGGEVALDLRTFGEAGRRAAPQGSQAGIVATADADAKAAADTAAAAPPQTDAARIDAIRQRIEARRAQQRAASQTSGATTPPKP